MPVIFFSNMFRFLCSRRLDRAKGFLNSGDSTSILLRSAETRFLIRTISSNPTHDNSFTVSYLVDSCGLSREKAVSASKKVRFKTPTKQDLVLNLFREHDFPNTHISKIIQKLPIILSSKVDKTLKPKLDFFNSIGLSGPDLSLVLSKNPNILMVSLANTIMPNIALLRTLGVPDCNICKLLLLNARSLYSCNSFNKCVEEAKKREFDPSKFEFVMAIHVLSWFSKSSWEAKLDIYKRWGWSEKEISTAFRLQPMCMGISEKNIMSTMEFLVNKMGYDPLLISKTPVVLLYSLEKRTILRLSVIRVLIANGIVVRDFKLTTLLRISENNFLRKYVTKFEGKVPELLSIYPGKTNGL